MKTSELQRPLSDSQRGELRTFLASVPSAMTLTRADGFLTGISSAPTTLMPSDWQPRLLGDHAYGSIEEAQRIIGLIMRLYNEILTGLNQGRAVRPPASLEDDELSEWCRGYLEASRMDEVWRSDEYGAAALLPFGVLAGEFDLVGEEDADGKIIEDPGPHIRKYRRSLPTWTLELHEYWTAWRREQVQPPARPASPRTGRNANCPCGSGWKYKKCCGR